MLVKTDAIVLSSIRYSEADLIVKCFTRNSGMKTYLLRGILKSKRGKLKASLFQPLTQLELEAYHRDKGKLEYIKEAKRSTVYESLHSDLKKTTVVMFLSEVLKSAIKEEEANDPLYQFLETALQWYDSHENTANFHLLFMVKLTKYLGFYPINNQENGTVFNLEEGTFQSRITHDLCLADDRVPLLQRFLGIKFDDLSTLKISRSTRSGLLMMLLKYYEVHLNGFQIPKSLAVLNEIYN